MRREGPDRPLPPGLGTRHSGSVPRPAVLASIALLLFAIACAPPPADPDPALLEAVDWYTGVAGTVDDARARELLEEAVDRGTPLAVMWRARVHSTGRMGYPRDEELARDIAETVIDEVQRAAESRILEAVFLMGTAYDEGLGKPLDPERAAAWHRRAAERGHVLGAHNLGNAYAAGRGVTEDHELAAEWWTRAADRGDAITQLRLGEAHEAGRGVPRDLERALAWYRRAAAAGNAQALEAVERLARQDGVSSNQEE
ncbi:MAG: tetratricopeptide repeat protein [Gemmatimonadetes bacterium]|nr:tetratricopeptide repeat protein [Gemmatimonadota bacterium]